MLNGLKERLADTLVAWAHSLYKSAQVAIPVSKGSPVLGLSESEWLGRIAESRNQFSHEEAVRAASRAYKANLTPAQLLEMYEKIQERQFVTGPLTMRRGHLTDWQRRQKLDSVLGDLVRSRLLSETAIERISRAFREDCPSLGGNPRASEVSGPSAGASEGA